MKSDIFLSIAQQMPALSKGHKRIAEYLVEHYDKASFVTASKLGVAVGVSESTVVRFANELGFDGYPALQEAMQESVRNRFTSVQRMEFAEDRLENQDIFHTVLTSDIEKIRQTLEQASPENFSNVVNAILSAKRIYIMGVRSSSALASFLFFYFHLLFENVTLVHTNSGSEMFEQLLHVKEGDAVIGISFPRYSHRTVNALTYAKDRGASVIGITDTVKSPLYKLSDFALLARSDMVSFADSLVAPLSVINALICAIGLRRRGELSERFSNLEELWHEYQVYEKFE